MADFQSCERPSQISFYGFLEIVNIIFESISTNQTITEICRKHGISPSTYRIWKDQFLSCRSANLYSGIVHVYALCN
ncbi:MAG: transposase [Thermoplasmataceae archaeon]